MQNAQETRLVSVGSAETPVLEFVVLTPIAQLPTTMLSVSVNLATLEMLLLLVKESPHVS